MTARQCFIATMATVTLLVAQLRAQDYDLVILNGRVMDPETRI